MMAESSRVPRLVTGEIEILEMLWRMGSATISQAHHALGRRVGYTTVQTRLNRLVKKRIVARTNDKPARYQAAVTREDVSQHDLNLLVERVSGGKIVPLVAQLVQDRRVTEAELHELKRLIANAEAKCRTGERKQETIQ